MKYSTIIFTVIILLLAVPATLYFFKPKVVSLEETILDRIPDEVVASFKPAAPDTVVEVVYCLPDGTFLPADKVPKGVDAMELIPLKQSVKTFKETLFEGVVRSTVSSFGPTESLFMSNDIVFYPNKANLSKLFYEELALSDGIGFRRGLGRGIAYGAAGGLTIGIMATYLIMR